MIHVQTKTKTLNTFALLPRLNEVERLQIENISAEKVYEKRAYVYFSEDLSEKVYILRKGRIQLCTYSPDGRELIKVILHPGDLFGELGLMGKQKRIDYAKVMQEDVLVEEMMAKDLQELMMQEPFLSMKIMSHISQRLQRIEKRLESFISKDVRTRIVEYLRETAMVRGVQVGDEVLLSPTLTHRELANLTATSRQTVTKVLSELRRNGLIYTERRNLLIRNLAQLV